MGGPLRRRRAPGGSGRGGWAGEAAVGHEPGPPPPAEQSGGVEVGLAAPYAQVQSWPGPADDLAPAHRFGGGDRHLGEIGVGGAEAVGVAASNRYNRDGKFVTLLGYETGYGRHGHINFYTARDRLPLVRNLRAVKPDFFRWCYGRKGILAIPHHPLATLRADPKPFARDPFRLVEIYSMWGLSECRGNHLWSMGEGGTSVREILEVERLPCTILLTKDAEILDRFEGYMPPAEIYKKLAAAKQVHLQLVEGTGTAKVQ